MLLGGGIVITSSHFSRCVPITADFCHELVQDFHAAPFSLPHRLPRLLRIIVLGLACNTQEASQQQTDMPLPRFS